MLELATIALRDDGCFSVMLWYGRPFAISVERTFENLETVIKLGQYRCHRSFYHHGGYPTFEIEVPGHDLVLFHKGNVETDSRACVVVGSFFGQIDGQTAVMDAAHGFKEFMTVTDGLDTFQLIVTGRRS